MVSTNVRMAGWPSSSTTRGGSLPAFTISRPPSTTSVSGCGSVVTFSRWSGLRNDSRPLLRSSVVSAPSVFTSTKLAWRAGAAASRPITSSSGSAGLCAQQGQASSTGSSQRPRLGRGMRSALPKGIEVEPVERIGRHAASSHVA